MNIDAIIKAAKLGRERKDAQVDTCAVFAAALYDVLSAKGLQCQMVTVVPNGLSKWRMPWLKSLGATTTRWASSLPTFIVSELGFIPR